jgi:hypothetical protein
VADELPHTPQEAHMTDPTRRSQSDRDGTAGRGSSGGLAGWQKVVGIVGLALLLVLAVLLAAGDHGPGRHAPGGSQEQSTNVEGAAGHDPSGWNH